LTGDNAIRTPLVSAIVVTWNMVDLLAGCLASLRDHGLSRDDMEIIVVDNGSVDGTVEMLAREWPEVRVIANAANLGFTKANNQGIEIALGRELLLINADAFLTPGCLARMRERLALDDRAAVVGPRLVYGDGTWQRWTAGRAPSLHTAVNHFFGLERLGRGAGAFAGLYLGSDVREARRVDWVSSACMVVRAYAFRAVGGMDERFFVYMDDVDLCQRLRDAGWHVWYEPTAEATHLMGQGSRRRPGAASAAALRGLNHYFSLRQTPASVAALKLVEILGFGLRTVIYASAAVVRREPTLGDKARTHWTFFRLMFQKDVRG
jgi:N-acetylglucosaminyl-diphospho-decaprenol L-rhamnosyltransferase